MYSVSSKKRVCREKEVPKSSLLNTILGSSISQCLHLLSSSAWHACYPQGRASLHDCPMCCIRKPYSTKAFIHTLNFFARKQSPVEPPGITEVRAVRQRAATRKGSPRCFPALAPAPIAPAASKFGALRRQKARRKGKLFLGSTAP